MIVSIFIFQICIAYSRGRVVEHECTGAEELLVRNLALKNYKATGSGVRKFSPLFENVLQEVGREIK